MYDSAHDNKQAEADDIIQPRSNYGVVLVPFSFDTINILPLRRYDVILTSFGPSLRSSLPLPFPPLASYLCRDLLMPERGDPEYELGACLNH